MNKTLKQIFSGFKAGFDSLMLLYFVFDLLNGYEPGIDLVMIALFSIDIFLSIDYIRMISKQKKQEAYDQLMAHRQQAYASGHEDARMANAIRQDLEASHEISPGEMAELLGSHNSDQNRKLPY